MRYQQLNRYNKIFSEKFYLLDITKNDNHYLLNVSGSTMNVYNLKLYFASKQIYCNCPDAKKWAKINNSCCKHICFVFAKICQLTYDQIENYNFEGLELDVYNHCEKIISDITFHTNTDTDIINDDLIAKFNELKTSTEPKKDIFKCESNQKEHDCPICYDKLEKDILKCPSCSNNMHKTCMEMWLNSGQNSCPYCRSQVWDRYLNKDNGQYYLNLLN